MYCPRCQAQCLETSLRCNQCGADLILHTVGDSEIVRKHSDAIARRYGNAVGGVIGVVLFIALSQTVLASMYWDRAQISFGAALAGGIGALVGRWLVARHMRHH